MNRRAQTADEVEAEQRASGKNNSHSGSQPRNPQSGSSAEDFSEEKYVIEMERRIGPLRCIGDDWFICSEGVWQPRNRDEFKPLALKVLPSKIRTQRKAKEIFSHLEMRNQVPRSLLFGAMKFGAAGEVLISTADCTLKLTPEGALALPTNPADGFTIALPIKWEPTAQTPLFEKVLAEAIEDEQDRELLLDVLATGLIPDCRYEKALVLIGETGTGKSTIGAVLPAIFGDACASLSLIDLCHPSGYKLALLNWKAINIGTELNTIELDDSGLFKQLVSGERFTARPIYGKPFEMRSHATLVFLANSMPRFRDGTEAEARRISFIRFENQVENPDVTLKDRISAEANGVFAMLVRRACKLLAGVPLTEQTKKEAIERFCVSNDPVGQFVKQCCELSPKYECPKEQLYDAFETFRDQFGISDRFDRRVFFRQLYDRFPSVQQIRTGTEVTARERVLLGIQLVD